MLPRSGCLCWSSCGKKLRTLAGTTQIHLAHTSLGNGDCRLLLKGDAEALCILGLLEVCTASLLCDIVIMGVSSLNALKDDEFLGCKPFDMPTSQCLAA